MPTEIIQKTQYQGQDIVLEEAGWFYGILGQYMSGPFNTKDECIEKIDGAQNG